MPPPALAAVRARAKLYAALRGYFSSQGFDEVETPCLVRAPGTEPHLSLFRSDYVPEMGVGQARELWLHTSPEYAMKRLLADGWERIFQLARCFRNGEISPQHNPEFTMLEFYRANLVDTARAGRGYGPILLDLEESIAQAARAMNGHESITIGGAELSLTPPWDRLPVAEAFASRLGIELPMEGDAALLRARALERGFPLSDSCVSYEDVFFQLFLTLERGLGWPRPLFLVDWPAPLAALSRLRVDDPSIAERFELYVAGRELANGFFELNDAAEQRRRIEQDRAHRVALGRPVPELDERFVEAVGRMPTAAGVAVGVDRLLMLLGGFASIDEVLLFPAAREW